MRPTTKDLAKAAGVSLATVDRVLNGRDGVRKKTVEAVNEAAGKIGFVRNQLAANLARRRNYRFEFLLPEAGDEFLAEVISRIEEARTAFLSETIDISYRQALPDDPHLAAQFLSTITQDRVEGVAIMATESPQLRDAITRLIARGVQVVQFIAGQPDIRPVDFVGIDNNSAGATAGRLIGRFTGPREGSVLVVSETMKSLDSVERRLGFDHVLTSDFPNLRALPSLETYGDPERTETVIKNSYHNHPDIVAAYVLSSEARLSLEAVARATDSRKAVIVAHERTAFTESMLLNGTLDAVIAQNPGHLVRSAMRLLRARSDGREPLASQEMIRIEILIKENLGSQ